MKRQRPENLTTWKSVSCDYTTHDTPRGQIWVFTDVLRALGVDDPDGQDVYVAVEMLSEAPARTPNYCGKMTMKSGQEIYGTDIVQTVEPNSRVRVMVSVPIEATELPSGRRYRSLHSVSWPLPSRHHATALLSPNRYEMRYVEEFCRGVFACTCYSPRT